MSRKDALGAPAAPPAARGAAVALLLILPALLIVAVFTLYPVGRAIWSSLHFESPFFPTTWAGLQNYIDVITGSYFTNSLRVTLVFTFFSVLITVVAGTGGAILLTHRFFGHGLLKPIALLPWAVPGAVAGIVWKAVFADSWGALNAVLYAVGIIDDYVNWLSMPRWAMAAAVIAQVWSQLPMALIFILTGLQNIPKSLYEAAQIDGAARLAQFFYITLPNIRVILVVVAVYGCLMGFSAYDIVYSLTHGGPGTATTVISYFTWAESFRMMNFGGGAALSVIIGAISLLFVFAFLRLIPADAILAQQKEGR